MRPAGTSERTYLGRVLTVRRRHGFCSSTESGKLPPSSSKNDISLDIRGALGMDLPFLQFRLKHVTALKKHLQTLRHPLHRFCPLKYPVVIDASFLSLYSQATQTAQAPESPSNSSAIYAFSNVLYRAPNAPADATCRGDNDTTLPWRRVPGVHPPDGLTFWADVRCLLMQVLVQGSLIWVPVLLVWIWRRYCTTRRRKILFVLIVLSLFLFPIRPRPGIRQWHGWRNIHRYHRTAAIIEGAEHFPPREPTIYAVFPHGIVPTAPVSMID